MLNVISRNWWVLLIRGIAAIIFGIGILFLWSPGLVIQTMTIVFGAYAIVDGVFAIIGGIQHREHPRWWAVVLEGIISIVAGIGAILFPPVAVLTLLYIIAIWAIATGVMEIIGAIQLRKEIDNEWMLIISGALSVIFGVVLLLGDPLSNILTLLWLFAGLAIAFGVVTVILAFRVRNMGGTTPTRTAA